jgi:hypothetical protein
MMMTFDAEHHACIAFLNEMARNATNLLIRVLFKGIGRFHMPKGDRYFHLQLLF